MTIQETQYAEETLDPADWTSARALAHRIVDDAIDHLGGLRDRPLWQAMPDAVRDGLSAKLPLQSQPLEQAYAEVVENLRPIAWATSTALLDVVHGGGQFHRGLADFLAAIDGSNLGGGNTAASLVDQQVTGWIRDMMGFPAASSGTLVNCGSMANIVGLVAARNAMAGVDLRELGVDAMPQPLRFYASDQVHNCHHKAMNCWVWGNRPCARCPRTMTSECRSPNSGNGSKLTAGPVSARLA